MSKTFLRIPPLLPLLPCLILSGLACSDSNTDPDGLESDASSPEGEERPDGGSGSEEEACAVPHFSPNAPLELLAAGTKERVQGGMACIADNEFRDILESSSTVLYDKSGIVPGYQDSFGDNVVAPIGMRPNTIRNGLIDLAVPGGHAQIFSSKGVFHFPFGSPIGAPSSSIEVVNFWHIPRATPAEGGALLPVVWWQRDPNDLTHRVEWVFPKGTVLGELMFLVDDAGTWHPFEIRTRTREIDKWVVDALRPFPKATDLADALKYAPGADTQEYQDLILHLLDTSTVQATNLSATNFVSAFPNLPGAKDVLPQVVDDGLLKRLLREHPFRSARETVWKESGGLKAYAATALAGSSLSIVPEGYNAGSFEVTEEACELCHRDAGRPLSEWYPNILAYGELWGGDESFTWHPFTTSLFVNAAGEVQNFNYDNREIRTDFLNAGTVAQYDPSAHSDAVYAQIQREWTNFVY
jgi:hypothetical protein